MRFLAITAAVGMIMTAEAQAMDHATRNAILDAARAPVAKALNKPVRFVVQQLRQEGRWVFLLAEMQEPGGHPIDYKGTSKAGAAAAGMASDTYAALLRQNGGDWTVVADAIGPTDVAWEDWPKRYGAPEIVFKP